MHILMDVAIYTLLYLLSVFNLILGFRIFSGTRIYYFSRIGAGLNRPDRETPASILLLNLFSLGLFLALSLPRMRNADTGLIAAPLLFFSLFASVTGTILYYFHKEIRPRGSDGASSSSHDEKRRERRPNFIFLLFRNMVAYTLLIFDGAIFLIFTLMVLHRISQLLPF